MLIVYLKKNINIFTNDYDDFVRGWFLKDLIKKKHKKMVCFFKVTAETLQNSAKGKKCNYKGKQSIVSIIKLKQLCNIK